MTTTSNTLFGGADSSMLRNPQMRTRTAGAGNAERPANHPREGIAAMADSNGVARISSFCNRLVRA